MHWLALRYWYDDAPWAALARGGGADGSRRAVVSAALWLKDLAEAGYASSVLDTPDLHRELNVAIGADRNAMHRTHSAGHRAVETWRRGSVGTLRQACFLPRSSDDAVALLGRCVPEAAFACAAYTLQPAGHGHVRATAIVRIGFPVGQFWPTPEQVAGRLGPPLLPVNGRHGPHVLATLPLAR